MTQRLRALRGPVACLAMVAAAVHLILTLIGTLYYAVVANVASGVYIATAQPTLAWALVVSLAVAGCALWGEPIPRARLMTLLAGIELVALALVSVVFGLVAVLIADAALRMAGVIVEGLVAGLAAVVMLVVHHGMPVRRPVPQPSIQPLIGSQSDPPSQSAQPMPQGYPTQWQDRRSQTDQFGNPGDQYRGDYQQNSAPSGSGDWHPAAQQPPHRLDPSPDRPPVAPHQHPQRSDSGQGSGARDDRDHGRSAEGPDTSRP